ncbi:Putative mitochondrial protein, partial [Durusdinium trenchii]
FLQSHGWCSQRPMQALPWPLLQSELQLARKVLRAYLSASETKASGVTWLDISSEVLRSKPPHMKVAPAMFKFIMNYAGGKSGHMLSATEAFVNTCGVNKSLGFELWDCVSQESKGKSKIPRLLARHALKLAYLQEDVLVTCAEIKKLLAGKELQPQVDKMESIILQIHKMGKGHEDACSGATLVKLQGLAVPRQEAQERGVPSALTSSSADKATGKIVSVDDGARVAHMQVGDKLMNVSGQSVLDGEWRVVREKSPAKVIPWENPLQGRILLAMLEADMPTNEDVCVLSNKEVKAAKAFKLRKLTLNACTSKIAVTECFEVSQSSVLLGTLKGWQVSLQSDVVLKQDIINPFWMMQVVDDKEQANMELVEKPDQQFDLSKFKVVLPLARNFKPVEPDDPLVLYRHPDTWKKAPPPVE